MSDYELWVRRVHEMPLQVERDARFVTRADFEEWRPATTEEISQAHPKCGTCYKCADDEGRRVCINGDSPMCTEDVDPNLDYCRFHKPEPKET